MTAERIALTSEVSATLATGRPIVALESTVIAQGLPWPENLETARAAEAAVRAAGAVPATIAVLDGTIRIGLTDSELVSVARTVATTAADVGPELTEEGRGPARHRLKKANRRDLAAIVAQGHSAATTVSATLWIARRFGLGPGVMATGGLGGVHRQAATSFDISTDLDELARADGALVVCSGLKSILDLPATLETLETRGVLVVGYRTDELPGFWRVRADYLWSTESTRPMRPPHSFASTAPWVFPARSSSHNQCPRPKPWTTTSCKRPWMRP